MVSFILFMGGFAYGMYVLLRLADKIDVCVKHEWKYDVNQEKMICKVCRQEAR